MTSAQHNDDLNIYLTIYCRKLRPDIQIISRSTLERNVASLYSAGANLVTVNLTPETVRGDYLLYTRERHIMTTERVLGALAAEQLEPSPVSLAAHYATAPLESETPRADPAGAATRMTSG